MNSTFPVFLLNSFSCLGLNLKSNISFLLRLCYPVQRRESYHSTQVQSLAVLLQFVYSASEGFSSAPAVGELSCQCPQFFNGGLFGVGQTSFMSASGLCVPHAWEMLSALWRLPSWWHWGIKMKYCELMLCQELSWKAWGHGEVGEHGMNQGGAVVLVNDQQVVHWHE